MSGYYGNNISGLIRLVRTNNRTLGGRNLTSSLENKISRFSLYLSVSLHIFWVYFSGFTVNLSAKKLSKTFLMVKYDK